MKRAVVTAEPALVLVSLQSAAATYDLSVKTLRRWISQGSLRAYKIGPAPARGRLRDNRPVRVEVAALAGLLMPIGHGYTDEVGT